MFGTENAITANQSNILQMEDLSIDVENFTGLVIFSIDDWEFCINFQDVLLILRGDEIKHVDSIKATVHLREEGKSTEFLLLNFASYFGLKERSLNSNTRMLFVQHKGNEYGFYVDSIKEIITTDKDFVRNKLEFISISGTDYIKGLIKFENRTFLFPDYDKIITKGIQQKEQKIV
jgi:Chemotaxis signal transduction protein